MYRIKCPNSDCPKEDRIKGLMDSCFGWIYSDSMRRLIRMFDGSLLSEKLGRDRKADIDEVHDFVKRWDFRGGKERWEVVDDSFVNDNKETILAEAALLGMTNVIDPQTEPDYILPLGGARMANYDRPMMAKIVVDKYGYGDKTIVALSGTRPLNDTERPYLEKYAPEDAATEYDAISAGLEKVFSLEKYEEEYSNNKNPNLCSAVRKYSNKYKGSNIYSLAAPSSDPDNRRANSYDTFKYLLEHFNIGNGDKLLLVTSCIYVPFQYLKFMNLAIDGGFEVDCIGTNFPGSISMSKPSNYLQEIKGTIDAIYGLYNELVTE